jgi:hypothetical protein
MRRDAADEPNQFFVMTKSSQMRYRRSVRFGLFCDISAGLADVCSWGNSRHSAASRRSGHVSESSSEGLRRPLGAASGRSLLDLAVQRGVGPVS